MTFSVKGVDGGYIIYYNNIRYQKKLLKSCKRVREGHSYGKKRDDHKKRHTECGIRDGTDGGGWPGECTNAGGEGGMLDAADFPCL